MQVLADAIAGAPHYADLLIHMLNRREAVDSSQIEGTHTQLDELLLHEIEVGTSDAVVDVDADLTLNYVHAYMRGVSEVRTRGIDALNTRLIRSLHRTLQYGALPNSCSVSLSLRSMHW